MDEDAEKVLSQIYLKIFCESNFLWSNFIKRLPFLQEATIYRKYANISKKKVFACSGCTAQEILKKI